MTRSLFAATLATLALAGCANSWFAPPPQNAAGMGAAAVAPAAVTVPVPVPVAASPEERLVAAIEAEGCQLNAGNVDRVLQRAGITQDDLVTLTPRLAAQGRAEVSGTGAIRVLTPNC